MPTPLYKHHRDHQLLHGSPPLFRCCPDDHTTHTTTLPQGSGSTTVVGSSKLEDPWSAFAEHLNYTSVLGNASSPAANADAHVALAAAIVPGTTVGNWTALDTRAGQGCSNT
jgi:hypothetical protein